VRATKIRGHIKNVDVMRLCQWECREGRDAVKQKSGAGLGNSFNPHFMFVRSLLELLSREFPHFMGCLLRNELAECPF
jgi:hypothetical protein